MNDSSHITQQPVPNRKPFFVVLGLFAAPLLLAFAVYYGTGWRPTGTTNKGDLITPAVPLPAVTLTTAQGAATDASFLRDTWTLVYVGPGACDEGCRTALASMRDARLLLGKEINRVSRVFLYSGSCCDAAYFDTQQQGLISTSVDSDAGKSLLALFPSIEGGQPLDARRIYMVDPLGNLMMSYAPGTDPRSIYQDIKKLLKLSHIG
jgi:cytochrome oxidase Cu insertion factor (SCO1/SenC/PrrC family)